MEISLRNYCIKCPRIGENLAFSWIPLLWIPLLVLLEGFDAKLIIATGAGATPILRVVNLLRVVFLVRWGDLLSWRTLCGHHFPGNYRHFSSQRRVHGVLNLVRGVVKTLRRSNSLFLLSS